MKADDSARSGGLFDGDSREPGAISALRWKAGEGLRASHHPWQTSRHRPVLGRNEEHARDKVSLTPRWRESVTAACTTISAVTRRAATARPATHVSAYSGSQIGANVSKSIGSPNSWITSAPSGLITATKPLLSVAGPAPATTK